jgi:hypothetical protein
MSRARGRGAWYQWVWIEAEGRGGEPSTEHGDTLGVATYTPVGTRGSAHVSTERVLRPRDPGERHARFREAFPDAELFDSLVAEAPGVVTAHGISLG